jgi:hypothetical protein
MPNISGFSPKCKYTNKMEKNKILIDLFQAYYDARKNKRNTRNALKFEMNYESNLFALYDEIVENRYKPKPSSNLTETICII